MTNGDAWLTARHWLTRKRQLRLVKVWNISESMDWKTTYTCSELFSRTNILGALAFRNLGFRSHYRIFFKTCSNQVGQQTEVIAGEKFPLWMCQNQNAISPGTFEKSFFYFKSISCRLSRLCGEPLFWVGHTDPPLNRSPTTPIIEPAGTNNII